MYEDDASTSQQASHNTNSENLKSVKSDYVKCRWFKKSEIKSLTHATIKEQIGNCTLCVNLPSSDCVQLPKCLCYFCRECFNQYLDRFATPKPVLQKSFLSLNPEEYSRRRRRRPGGFLKKNSKIFEGVFDANSLSFEGNVLPKQVKPPKPKIIKKVSDFEERHLRQNPWVVGDNHLYKLAKVEVFDCPNCHTSYDGLNRLDLKRNRAVSDIIEVMNKNEDYTQMH